MTNTEQTKTQEEVQEKKLDPQVKEPTMQVHKAITPMVCPHCSKKIMVAVKSVIPSLEWVLREEDLAKAKSKVIETVEKTEILSVEEKADVLEWLKSKEFVFGPAEVEMILERILNKK